MRPSLRLLLLATLTPAATLVAQGVPPDRPGDFEWNRPPSLALPAGSEYLTFQSASMDREIGYVAYRPSTAADGPLPVLYWLSGEASYSSDLPLLEALVSGMEAGSVEPMALVIASGAPSGYLDEPATGLMGESVVIRELLPHAEESLDVGGTQDSRAIGGLGIGGGAAVGLALRHPETFGTIVSLGGALVSATEIEELFGVSSAVAADADPYPLAIEVAPRLRRIASFFRAGSDDPWIAANRRFAAHLGHQNLTVDYREIPRVGGTIAEYLDAVGPDLFRFLSTNLN